MVRDGRVAVNGRVLTELPILIDPQRDRIEVDGDDVRIADTSSQARVYILLNKPKGVYSTNVAQGAQVRVIDLLPPNLHTRVYPVGRLDAESKGLLLLTNDGDLTNRLTHPRYGVPKTYRAVIDGQLPPDLIQQLEKGMWLANLRGTGGVKTGPSKVKVVSKMREKSVLEITIREGFSPEIRRMLAKLGHKVRDLCVRMGPLTLEGLSSGKCRPLTSREVRQLQQYSTSRKVEKEPKQQEARSSGH